MILQGVIGLDNRGRSTSGGSAWTINRLLLIATEDLKRIQRKDELINAMRFIKPLLRIFTRLTGE
jgi:hypothetical protein